MQTYTFLRALADSWVLLALTTFFIGTIVWAFRPGGSKAQSDAANIPFRNDKICSRTCDDCRANLDNEVDK